MIIDTHAHLDAKDFGDEAPEVIARALDAGVDRIITIGAGYGVESASRAVAIAEKYPNVWATVGVHPHDSGKEIDWDVIEFLAKHPRVVAIGETGLDYFRDWAPVNMQKAAFQLQIRLAKAVKKPLVIHSREAGSDCLAMLQDEEASTVGGVFHCYAENEVFAQELAKINFLVSFTGAITFKKAEETRRICKAIPLSQIMVETDSPFLAPEPHRGKRCESAFTALTARKVAEVHGVTLEEVARITTQNAEKLFGLRSDV